MSPRSGMLDRAVAILGLFSETHVEWKVADIATAVDLPIPTTYRIVGTLSTQGLLRPTTTGYRLGAAALDLGRRAAAGFDLGSAIGGELRALAAETRETCVLAVLDESSRVAICVDRVDSAQPVRLSLEVGRRIPLHAGASSKALLAHAPLAVREAILGGPLPQLAPRTVVSTAELSEELENIRTVGFSVSREETNEGAWGVAAPILGRGGVLLGSIGMVAPLSRFTDDALAEAQIDVVSSAKRAATSLTG